MAVEIVRLRPYGAALKDTWTHFPTGGEASARTNKNKTHEETPGTSEGVEATVAGKGVQVKAGASGAPYSLPAGAKVIGFKLWAYAKAGTVEKDVKVQALYGSTSIVNFFLETTSFEWHSAAATKAAAEALTKAQLEELTFKAATEKAVGTADQLVEWHVELEVELSEAKVERFNATLSFQGTLRRLIKHPLAATVSFTGTLPRKTIHGLAASLEFVGTLPHNATHRLAAELTSSGTLGRSISHRLAASLEFTGTLRHNVQSLAKQIAGSLTSEGVLQRSITRLTVAKLESKGTIPRVMIRAFAAAIEFKGAVTKVLAIVKTFTASLEPKAALTKALTIAKVLAAKLETKGSLLAKKIGGTVIVKLLTATLFPAEIGGLVDSFKRGNESPLSNEGRWTKLTKFSPDAGQVQEEAYHNTKKGVTSQAYWNASEYTEPTVTATIHTIDTAYTNFELYGCLKIEGEEIKNAYRLEWEQSKTFKQILLIRYVAGSAATIGELIPSVALAAGDKIRLVVSGGRVKAQRKKEAGEWETEIDVADTNLTKGNIGLGIEESNISSLQNFEVEERTVITHLGRNIAHQLKTAIEFKGGGPHNTKRAFVARLSFFGKLALKKEEVIERFVASLSFVGNRSAHISRASLAVMSFAGTMEERIRLMLAAAMSFVGTSAHNASHRLTASITSEGSAGRRIMALQRASLELAGTISPKGVFAFSAILDTASALPRTIYHRLAGRIQPLGLLLLLPLGRLIHFFAGPDKLISKIPMPSLTLVAFQRQVVVPDELVRQEPPASITELPSGTFEDELPLPPYARVHGDAGLEERDRPASVKTDLPNHTLTLIEEPNELLLEEGDLAED